MRFNSHQFQHETDLRIILKSTNSADLHEVYLSIIISSIFLTNGLPIKDLQKMILDEIPGSETKKRVQRSYIKRSAESLSYRLAQLKSDKTFDTKSVIEFLAKQGVSNTFELRKWLGLVDKTPQQPDSITESWASCSACNSLEFKYERRSGALYCAKCMQRMDL